MSLRRTPAPPAKNTETRVDFHNSPFVVALQKQNAYRTENVGVYARPPSTSTPELAAALGKALQKDRNKLQINKLLDENRSDNGNEMILLASAGKSKKDDLLKLRRFDPIAQWTSGFLYMAFTPVYSNVVNAVNDLNMENIAHVWLMPDGSIEPVTKESMRPWSLKWMPSGGGMDVPVHWVDNTGELLPRYAPA